MACDASIYGPFSQTLFMGASIVSYSSRIGWNSNESNLDVEVIEDSCSSAKIYYDCETNPQIHTGADAFIPPTLGSPVYFQFGSFSYTGILRNWKEKYDNSKTYLISCSGPNLILDAVKVIVGGYTGDVLGIPNIINAYGFLEEYAGGLCPIDPSLYTLLGYYPALGFGGASRTDAGISWNSLKGALSLLINSSPQLSGKFGVRPQFKGNSYYIDISDLPLTMDDFRIGGDSLSLLDIINMVCDYAGLDWFASMYIDPLYPGTCNTSIIQGTIASDAAIYIKINVSDRKTQPTSASNIDASVADADTRLALGTITSYIATTTRSSADRGIELRPETTNALIVGDQRQDLWVMNYVSSGVDTYNSNIWFYWGKHANGYPIISYDDYDQHNFNIDISDLYETLIDDVKSGVLGTTYNVELGELLAILAEGGKSNWENYVTANKSGLIPYLDIAPDGRIYNIVGAKGAAVAVKTDNCKATSRYDAQKAQSVSVDENADFAQRLYNKLEGYANEYLGKKFVVAPPVICSAVDANFPYNIQLNWTESDGAWSDTNPWGLGNTPMELFRLPDGRIKCMLRFNNSTDRIDMSNWDAEKYYQPSSGVVYVEANAEEIIFLDPVNRIWPRIVVSIDKPVSMDKVYLDGLEYASTPFMTNLMSFMAGGDRETRLAMQNNLMTIPGADTCMWDRYPMPLIPTSAAVPLKSNILRYGPWYAASYAAAGDTKFEIISDLSPWNYGSTTTMNTVGQALADNQVMAQQVIELGSITVPGAPAYSLGDTLAVGSPEVTSIDVSMSSDGVRSTYQLRTFTPDYNSFSKTRIDNLKKTAERARGIQRLNNLARINQIRTPTTNNALGTILNRSDRYRRTSSHAFMLAATFHDWDVLPGISPSQVSGVDQLYETDRVINCVVNTDLRKCLPELAASGDDWLRRAGVETAGLFRPFTTKSGESCLMASFPTGVRVGLDEPEHPDMMHNYANNRTYMFRGPVYNEALPPIMCATLNPFLQSADSPNSSTGIIIRDNYDPTNIYFTMGSGYGHDIEYVVRDGVYPIDLSIKYPETNYSSSEWYRGIGLKGPPVIVGWGYDVCGKPVPNYREIEGSGGTSCKFADDWLQRPDLWKAGPLDIRWDYRRGVWTSPPSYRVVRVKMLESSLGWNPIINAEIVDDAAPAIDMQDNEIHKYIAMRNPMGYSSASGSYAWAIYNPETTPSTFGNYASYDLLYWENPVFTLRTYAPSSYDGINYNGALGYIFSASPSFGNYQDFRNNVILGGAACSGQTYTCTYHQYNEVYGTHEFLPTNSPVVTLDGILNGDTVTTTLGSQVLKVYNALSIQNGIHVYIQWNNIGTWYVINAEAYNTPITTVSS